MEPMICCQLQSTDFEQRRPAKAYCKGPAQGVCAPLRKCDTFEAHQPCAQPATESTLEDWETESGEAGSDDSFDSEASFVADPETLIFVDCDGVVNVGIRDGPGQAPLLLCEKNLARCKPCDSPPPVGSAQATSHIMFSTAYRQVGHGDEGTYSKFATPPDSSDICPLLAHRLAEILSYAGPHSKMVLSSSWRKTHHQKRVEALEATLSKYSGKNITFDARTKPGSDGPQGRIELIGDFVHEYSENRQRSDRPLRVVVLEDFAATHPQQFNSQSIESVEAYWRQCSFQPEKTSVKLVHCYEEWTTSFGQSVQVGTGLTRAKVCEAERFLLDKPPMQLLR